MFLEEIIIKKYFRQKWDHPFIYVTGGLRLVGDLLFHASVGWMLLNWSYTACCMYRLPIYFLCYHLQILYYLKSGSIQVLTWRASTLREYLSQAVYSSIQFNSIQHWTLYVKPGLKRVVPISGTKIFFRSFDHLRYTIALMCIVTTYHW